MVHLKPNKTVSDLGEMDLPDTFHEDRLLGQPPGVNMILVLYSRFHNNVATLQKEINEDERFTLRLNADWENQTQPPRNRSCGIYTGSKMILSIIIGWVSSTVPEVLLNKWPSGK